MSFSDLYFREVIEIAEALNKEKVEILANTLASTRDLSEGRVFILGVGGSAGNASHMVNDLRKLCGIEAYCPTDNVSEVTARTNDEGFDTVFCGYLQVSRLSHKDTIFILSVGGGDEDRNVSVGLIKAIKYARSVDATIVGIVGKNDGYTAINADAVVVVPQLAPSRITPHSEAFQAIVWHCLVSHPKLQINATKW
ncbi:GmhA Phosphoheptose isomerase [uncultured Caudovirales phage]|uniref:GmhA Phosphoheptose isomerase n=1 Tax=uncultured Caudovirales phage TaxID=2100421 RepID=A0A6J5LAL8_9CAUD|nr:GmhA Phosphoheptose isomerase [uncultured Caudovirales phage]